MFPSHFPVPYLIHLLVVFLLLTLVGVASWYMNQPLGLALVVFGLNALPSLPIVEEGDGGMPPESDYNGSGGAGFVK